MMQSATKQVTMSPNEPGPTAFEKMELNPAEHDCSVDNCESDSLIVLAEKPLCLQHFLSRCYDWLDTLDPLVRGKFRSDAETARAQSLVEECSNRALLVSLRCETLCNLDRSRLLDILLRSSDMLFQLRCTETISAWLPAFPSESVKPRRPQNHAFGSHLQTDKLSGT